MDSIDAIVRKDLIKSAFIELFDLSVVCGETLFGCVVGSPPPRVAWLKLTVDRWRDCSSLPMPSAVVPASATLSPGCPAPVPADSTPPEVADPIRSDRLPPVSLL